MFNHIIGHTQIATLKDWNREITRKVEPVQALGINDNERISANESTLYRRKPLAIVMINDMQTMVVVDSKMHELSTTLAWVLLHT